MKAKIFGVLCCATFAITIAAYLPQTQEYLQLQPFMGQEVATGSTLDRQIARHDQASLKRFRGWPWEQKEATSLAAVGWRGCKWCKKFKDDVLPVLVEEGYDVRYVDIGDWEGPEVKFGPTLFYFADKKKIVKVEKGYRTPEQVKKYLHKPDEQ